VRLQDRRREHTQSNEKAKSLRQAWARRVYFQLLAPEIDMAQKMSLQCPFSYPRIYATNPVFKNPQRRCILHHKVSTSSPSRDPPLGIPPRVPLLCLPAAPAIQPTGEVAPQGAFHFVARAFGKLGRCCRSPRISAQDSTGSTTRRQERMGQQNPKHRSCVVST